MTTGSAERFGYQWQRYHQLHATQEEQFRRWLPFLTAADWRGLRFVDAGCGMGRNSVWPMRDGAAGGLACDVDERTLGAARRTLDGFPGLELRRLSIYDLPGAGIEPVDVAFSIGVIHHLEDPEAAVRALAAVTRPGGRVCIWVYGFEGNEWIERWVSPLRRRVLCRLPMPALHLLSAPLATGVWLVTRSPGQRSAYLTLLRQLGYGQIRNIVLDQLLPRIARYYRRDQVEALLAQAGLVELELRQVNGNSWAASGRRPR
jgi:SAM-dependent methyltransferase